MIDSAPERAGRVPRPRVLFLVKQLALGGAERTIVTLAGQLQGPFDVTVGYFFGHDALRADLDRIGVPLVEISGTARALPALARLRRVMRRLEPDVVNAHDPYSAILARLAAATTRTPVVTTLELVASVFRPHLVAADRITSTLLGPGTISSRARSGFGDFGDSRPLRARASIARISGRPALRGPPSGVVYRRLVRTWLSGPGRRATVALVVVAVAMVAGPAGCADASSQQEQGRQQREPARPPAAGGYFELSPVGAAFPTDRRCARSVRRSSWEPRPNNDRANHTTPRRVRLRSVADYDGRWNARYRPRVTGAFAGTTDEIIQWAACKWGLSDELLRAQISVESRWVMGARGDPEPRSEGNCTVHDRSDPCPTSFGLLQNKWYFNRPAYPMLRTMTSFHLDWSAAQLRGCYDGRKGYPAGDFWACLGNWFSGRFNDPEALDYMERVRVQLDARPWLTWPDRGGKLPYRTRLRAVA